MSVSFAYGTTNAGDDEHISEKDVMSDAFWIALFAGLPAIIAAVVSAMTARHQAKLAGRQEELIVKTSTVETKIDNNTAITRSGTAVAARNAKEAANTAIEASEAAQSAAIETREVVQATHEMLNGSLTTAIQEAIKPLHDDIVEIRALLKEMKK